MRAADRLTAIRKPGRPFFSHCWAWRQACSSAQVYEGVRVSNQRDCSQYQGSAYDECMEQYDDNFQRYDKKRKQLEQLEQTDQAEPR